RERLALAREARVQCLIRHVALIGGARVDAVDHGMRAPAARVGLGDAQAPHPEEAGLAQHLGHVPAFEPAHHRRLAARGDPEAYDEEELRLFHRLGTRVHSMTTMIVRSTAALSASDKCMPIRLPARPTVTPLNARSPIADMAKSPITRPRTSSGACICTSVCVMAKNESSRKPATASSASATG